MKEKELKERQRKELEENEKLERERQRKEFKKQITCACGIQFQNICHCEIPDYILFKINNELLCQNCTNWKCRCK